MNKVDINIIAKEIILAFKKGKKLLIIGNGGSAAMAQHMAAELVGKFKHDRKALPAIALSTDTSFITSYSNDYVYGFSFIFSRQIEALGKKGDVLIAFSTSGFSENIVNGMITARENKMIVIDFPRRGKTDRCQEYQMKLMHKICEQVENAFL